MSQNVTDLGFDHLNKKNRKRSINSDGSFNVKRLNHSHFDFYRWLTIESTWWQYIILIVGVYVLMNMVFAFTYFWLGVDVHLYLPNHSGVNSKWQDFLDAFFFSAQTFTTVGYGNLAPKSNLVSMIAAFEAMLGFLTFALATGTLFGRFSKAKPKIKHSENAVICNFKAGRGLMVMIANRRSNVLSEVEAQMTYSYLKVNENGVSSRVFSRLKLELDKISMLAINWVVVHPIDEESPFYGKNAQDLAEEDGEIFLLIKSYDDTYANHVHSRISYLDEEIIWDVKFERPFEVNDEGVLVLDLDKVGKLIPQDE